MGNSVTYRMEMSAENMRNIFGEGDQYIKKIEKELQVAIVNRDGFLSVIGGEKEVKRAVGYYRSFPNCPVTEEISENKKWTTELKCPRKAKRMYSFRWKRI